MKHLSLTLQLFALVAAMMCALSASAAADVCDFSQDGIFYKIQSGGTTVHVWYEDGTSWDPCYTAASYDIPETVTHSGTTYTVTGIGHTAFYGCTAVTQISLPKTLTKIDSEAFFGCTSLNSVCCYAMTPPTLQGSAFNGLYNQVTLYVPASAVSTYQAATNWENFSNIQPIEAYACYTPSNTTLTFYCDNKRSSRPGTTYDLNTGTDIPGWYDDGTYTSVTRVVINSSFANARPTSTYAWFASMENLQSITGMEYLNTSEVTIMDWMFDRCESLTSIDLSHFNTANVTSMKYMLAECNSLTSLDVSSFNTSNVTNMQALFGGCESLTDLDVSNFNTSNVTDMAWMFCLCSALTSLDLSNINTSNVARMDYMFADCNSLTSLDLSKFNTSRVANMDYMFKSCNNLKTIYVGDGWSTTAVTNSNDMFKYCDVLVGGKGTTYDENHVDAAYAHIDGGPSNPGYFTAFPSLDEALNVEGGTLHFTTGGDYPWKVVQDDGRVYAQSSNAGVANSSSVLTATVTVAADAEVQFDLMARGDGNSTIYDKCIFAIDGNQVFSFGGNMGAGWGANRSSLSAGTHTLTWSYIKDGSVNPDGDFFAIDNVAIISGGLPGDVNGDGRVNVSDVTTLINMILGLTPMDETRADVNGDGRVNVSDVTALINIILGIS